MQKTIKIIIVLLLCSISSYAQQKGDMYFGISAKASFGSLTSILSPGSSPQTATKPENIDLGAQIEISYFTENYLRVSLAFGIGHESVPVEQEGLRWRKTNTTGVQINPNISPYIRLSNRLFYTPELGGAFEFGMVNYELPLMKNNKTNYTAWTIYTNFLAFEFSVTDEIAIGMTLGSFSYSWGKNEDLDPANTVRVRNPHFSFNDSSISLRYYF